MSTKAETSNKRWQIRMLAGPNQGTAWLIGRRLSIGRAATSDIHIGNTDVSRQHAHVVEHEEGRHMLVDLSSSNGTFIDGERINRLVLEPNTTFTIAGYEMIYEQAHERSGLHRVAPATDGRTLRATSQMPRYDAPTQVQHTAEELAARFDATTRDYPTAEELAEYNESQSSATTGQTTDSSGRPLVFETPGGGEYDGNLLDDILEYRSLRAQRLRGGLAESSTRQRFESLREQLQQPPSEDPKIAQRAFCRFGCWLPARLRLASGKEHACQMRDLGVDGAQLVLEEHAIKLEAIVWLTIELLDGARSRAVVLAGRVAWTDDQFLGLAFAGTPRIQGRYAEQSGPQNREQMTDGLPPRGRLRLS